MSDEFAFSQVRPKYDPNSYYVATTDSKGHYERRQLRFPPGVWNQLVALAADSSNPFRSPDDYVRNAVFHQLHRDAELDDADPAFVRNVAEIIVLAALETQLAIAETRKKLVSTTHKIAQLAAAAPPSEKDRLMALLRLQSLHDISEEAKQEIENVIKRYEQ